MIRWRILLLLFLLPAAGCGREEKPAELRSMPPVFAKERVAGFERVSQRDIPARAVRAIFPYKDYMVIAGDFYDHFVEIYDKRTGEFLSRGIARGRGPGEAIAFGMADLNPLTGAMTLFDHYGCSIVTVDIDDLIWNTAVTESRPSPLWLSSVFQIDESHWLYDNMVSLRASMGPATRLEVKRDTTVTASYSDFLIKDDKYNANFDAYNQHRASLSPDRTKFVTGTLIQRTILEMFEVKKDTIRSLYGGLFYGSTDPAELSSASTIGCGFSSLYAGDDKVLAIMNSAVGDRNGSIFDLVCLFDWRGRGLERIRVDNYSFCIAACLDYDGKTVYGVVRDDDNYFYYLVKMTI